MNNMQTEKRMYIYGYEPKWSGIKKGGVKIMGGYSNDTYKKESKRKLLTNVGHENKQNESRSGGPEHDAMLENGMRVWRMGRKRFNYAKVT